MTLKLTIQYSKNKNAIAYVANDALILVGNNLVAAKEATAVSILSNIRMSDDKLLHANNNIIVPISKIEQVGNIVVSYIDPTKKNEFAMPVLGVFVPSKNVAEDSKSGYKMYFAMMTECE